MLPLYDVLDYFQAITPYFVKRFCHYTITNFYADLRIVFSKKDFQELDFKKVAQGGEYQNFLLNKKFFIHLFFSPSIQLALPAKNSFFFYKTHVQPA
jgi:hypothetical protein